MLSPLIYEKEESNNIPKQKNHLTLAISEAKCIGNIAFPMIFTGLILYSRSIISMIFLGHLGELSLAGGSLAIGFANITEWWWYEIMILLCGILINPQSTVASMGILIQTTSLIYIFPSSLSFGVSTRVGNELGANRPNRAKLAAIIGLCTSFILGISSLFFAILVRNIWAKMFTQDQEIMKLTAMVLPIIGLCELGNCPQTTGCGVLRGTARPKLGANVNLGCFYLVGMPIAIWLSFFMGFDFKGLWLGLLAAQGSCAVTMMLIILVKTNWEDQARRAKELINGDCHDNQDEKIEDYLESLDYHKLENSNV
ncbi:hypothetical protein H5410_043624 [Solanum commersonii]|uniref:Uncharacterized protein n=1 Tax=Solanum commersonii TaxID=4109 RepID=A0A9J5Y1W7_SOLCO|nr:hypothetical protein H5410_043624 [Solanum commersonii]